MIPTTPVSPSMALNGLLGAAVGLNPALMEIIAGLCFTLIAVDLVLGVYDSWQALRLTKKLDNMAGNRGEVA